MLRQTRKKPATVKNTRGAGRRLPAVIDPDFHDVI
jgi:hypothetical protein